MHRFPACRVNDSPFICREADEGGTVSAGTESRGVQRLEEEEDASGCVYATQSLNFKGRKDRNEGEGREGTAGRKENVKLLPHVFPVRTVSRARAILTFNSLRVNV